MSHDNLPSINGTGFTASCLAGREGGEGEREGALTATKTFLITESRKFTNDTKTLDLNLDGILHSPKIGRGTPFTTSKPPSISAADHKQHHQYEAGEFL